MPTSKCIIILSEKSSGSSACQNLLAQYAEIGHVTKTRHFQNETLYWTNAASILGLPQLDMLDSLVPLERAKAKSDMIALLKDNLKNYSPPDNDKELVFGGWRLLCEEFSPIFLEKSPHHLFQWSALELIVECINKYDDIDFLLIGLVRNPMDTIYSQFKRWRTRPEELQNQWITSYQNLLKLKKLVGDKLVIIRYEDMVSSIETLQPVFDFCNARIDSVNKTYLHQKSISKWKNDSKFGFRLSDTIISFSQKYGYSKESITNESTRIWPLYREYVRIIYKFKKPLKIFWRKYIKRVD